MTRYGFDQLDENNERRNIHLSVKYGKNGKPYSHGTGLGYTLSILPAVAAAEVLHWWYGIPQTQVFPLQASWPIHLFAPMINPLWAAVLILGLITWLQNLGFNKKNALWWSVLIFLTTNLFPLSKHTFAHTGFTALLVWTTLSLHQTILKKSTRWAVLTGLFFGGVTMFYNVSFLFTIPALVAYALSLWWPNRPKKFLLSTLWRPWGKLGLFVLLGYFPGFLLYRWYNLLRNVPESSDVAALENVGSSVIQGSFFHPLLTYEALWGIFFSPGRSIFVYSPILLILVLWWSKLQRKYRNEIILASVLSLTYLAVYTTFSATTVSGTEVLWHGESSYGPRYFSSLLPFLGILIATICQQLKSKISLAVVSSLFLLSFGVQVLGIVLPYQVKTNSLPLTVIVADRNYNFLSYTHWFPALSAPVRLSKYFLTTLKEQPAQWQTNPFSTELIDGFGPPDFFMGSLNRNIEGTAYLAFQQDQTAPLQTLEFSLYNVPLIASEAGTLTTDILLGDTLLGTVDTKVSSRSALRVSLPNTLTAGPHTLEIRTNNVTQISPLVTPKQALLLTGLTANNQPISLQRTRVPFITQATNHTPPYPYRNWSRQNTSWWRIWELRQYGFQHSLDFWWLRLRLFWDIPQRFITMLLIGNLTAIGLSLWATVWTGKKWLRTKI